MIPDSALQPHRAKSHDARTNIDQITAALAQYPIDSTERVAWAGQVITELAEQRAAWTAERDSVAKPLRAIAKKVGNWWKPAIDAADAAIDTLKNAVKTYRDQVAAEQARRLEAAAVAPTPETHAELARTVAAAAPLPPDLGEREVWRWEIENRSEIPAEYFLLDEQRISREVRERKHDAAIPGIRVVRDTTVVRR